MREGLSRVMADTPLRSGYLEAVAGMGSAYDAFVRAELGIHPARNLSAFAFGERRMSGWDAGVGVKWAFDF